MSDDPRIEAAAHVLRKYFPTAGDGLALRIAEEQLAAADRAAWRPISEASENPLEQVLIWTSEGWDISSYSPEEQDGQESMGHDGGWWGAVTSACPGRHMGNPEYYREAECQPTHYQPLPAPPEDSDV